MNRRTQFAAMTGAAVVMPAAARAVARPAARAVGSREVEVATRDGQRLYVQDLGRGRPVVFVHGWTMSSEFWEYQTEALQERGLRCVAYDQRSCGRSSVATLGYEMDSLADDLDEVMRALDLRDAVMVAHSMGCAQVARYLSRHGAGRVARVALVSSTTPGLVADPVMAQAMLEKLEAAMRADRPQYMHDLSGPFFAPARVSPALVQWGVDIVLKAPLRASIEYTRTNLLTDMTADLKSFTMPTLVIHGAGDASAPLAATGARTAAAIRGARLEVYEDAPHGLPLTHAARLNRDLLAFAGA